jgi:alpha-L-fucosidase
MKTMRCWIGVMLGLAFVGPCFAEDPPSREPSPADMEWFREARFGMFIHWGLYSQLAGEWQDRTVEGGAEWIQKYLEIPSSEYSPLAKTWNPVGYYPHAWVRLMKAAGIRYVCITSKHHDGFCLWPTQTNDDWNIAVTPHGKDLLKPLADACREQDVTFCLYHSVLDWRHPDWPARPGFNDYATGVPDKERFKRDYLFPQLKELFGNYGKIGMLWLDGTWDKEWTSADGKELEAYIRSLQPDVVLNNRSGYKPPQPDYGFEVKNAYSYVFAGDYISPEGEVPPTGLPGIDWETCQTMQLPNNWGYNRLVGFRPFNDLLRQLVDVASKGGNLLLNIGPDADGRILPQAVTCLEKFAGWMAVNSESIHGTTASPFEALPFDGRCTRKGNLLYLHVFGWPEDGKLILPVRNPVSRAWMLAEKGVALAIEQGPGGAVISLPEAAPDPVVSVVAVEVDGEVDPLPEPVNLAAGRPVEVSSVWEGRPELKREHITDGDPGSMWATEEHAREGSVTIDLGAVHLLAGLVLSDAPYGRIRSFAVEARANGQWLEVAEGTTVGSGRRIDLSEIKADAVRLVIRDATDTPTLADFQVLGLPEE